ncbi:WD repeat-containing protein 19 [Cichlidogyrus casuarinus]|uniref:WD repeat-containing protein 19 n=1 Tax=Cichlidogyrus casuarinus TaxID=1844966 RepID=A0ABD2Q3G0_9PLAT
MGCLMPESPVAQQNKSWKSAQEWSLHLENCNAGIARCAIQLGEVKRGVRLAKNSQTKDTLRDCAILLEVKKNYCEAANLFEDACMWDEAVRNWLLCKNYDRAGELLSSHMLSPSLYEDYAKVREAEGQYRLAVEAYRVAQDWASCVRIYLERLGSTDEAVKLIQQTKNVSGAKLIADYFTRIGDHKSALQFLVYSHCVDIAFRLAEKNNLMREFASFLEEGSPKENHLRVAQYFEGQGNCLEAGRHYLKAQEYDKSVNLLLKVPYSQQYDQNPALELALQAIEESKDEAIGTLLMRYLKGELDRSEPKDAQFLFKLYMARQQYKEAGHTAVIIAREQRNAGNYRAAHTLLHSMIQELRDRSIRVPMEMLDSLKLLHSYILAKHHIKQGNHLLGARLLIRVAESINTVPILTSTVIECQKAGLKQTGFHYAAMLLRPEYRDKIDPKYAKKFETIVRKTDTNAQESDPRPDDTPCPFCGLNTCSFELMCKECKNRLPFCIITGEHICRDDFTVCPGCCFPASYKKLFALAEEDDAVCPMCCNALDRNKIRRITDCANYLKEKWLEQPALDAD